ncbi:MAG: hypoxanthine phosphoribosyltransferase [Peptococcaceae bacterium]|jgi:hypoxanthine phosphoribosyltransferase|nr:hypoxanthine phosphoribosyltransferase [Peptococcaceae bacterium]
MFEIGSVLFSARQIQSRVRELGEEISRDYAGKELLMVGILKGAAMFMMDLAREIHIPVQMDFMSLSSYGAATESTGTVQTRRDLDADISNRHVLVVEDIVDTGLTLNYLKQSLQLRQPASVKICAFLDKPARRKLELEIEYKGYVVEGDDFLVGYGLDMAEEGRALPYIAAVRR